MMIAAGVQVGGVDGGDDIGAGNDQVVMAAVVAMVVVGAQRGGHDGRAHGAVEDKHLLAPAALDVRLARGCHPGHRRFQRFPTKTASSRALVAWPCPMVNTWMPGTP